MISKFGCQHPVEARHSDDRLDQVAATPMPDGSPQDIRISLYLGCAWPVLPL
jgi:hypothetical protein